MDSLGKTIKVLRAAAGLKQFELADAAGISQNYLSLIESDRKDPSLQVIGRLADTLGVPSAGLFFLSSPLPDGLSKKEVALFADLRSLLWHLAHQDTTARKPSTSP